MAVFPIVAVIVPPLVVASGAVVIITFVILLILLRHRKCLGKCDGVVEPLRYSRLMSQTSYTSEQQHPPTDGNGRAIGTEQEQSHDRDSVNMEGDNGMDFDGPTKTI